MMSISLRTNGRLSHTSERADLAWVQSPQFSRVNRVILQAWKSRVVTRILLCAGTAGCQAAQKRFLGRELREIKRVLNVCRWNKAPVHLRCGSHARKAPRDKKKNPRFSSAAKWLDSLCTPPPPRLPVGGEEGVSTFPRSPSKLPQAKPARFI